MSHSHVGDDDNQTEPEIAATEEAEAAEAEAAEAEAEEETRKTDEARSVAHGSSSPEPDQIGHDNNRSHSRVGRRQAGEAAESHPLPRSAATSPLSGSKEPPSRGLHINGRFGWSRYDDYDVITVHGIRDDPKTAWQTRDGTWWVHDELFEKLTIREIDFSYYTHEEADIFKPDGIAREARRLLTDYTSARENLPSTEVDRPVIWICHDIGGHIVKQALMYAAMNPKSYSRIALLTTVIIFLGVPHRAHSMEELEDQLHQLLILPGPGDIKQGIVQKIRGLAEQVAAINTQFLELGLTSRAVMVNIFSSAKTPELRYNTQPEIETIETIETIEPKMEESEKPPTSPPLIAMFPRYSASMGFPFETQSRWRSAINHLDLIHGVRPEDEQGGDINWIPFFAKLFNTPGLPLQVNYRLIEDQGKFLSLMPPLRTANVGFDPNAPKIPSIAWINKQEAYTKFSRRTVGQAILYLHGGEDHNMLPDISQVCQKFYLDHDLDLLEENDDTLNRYVACFEFDKRDSRYNNLSSMLLTFLNDLIWHFWEGVDLDQIFEPLTQYRSLSLEDLYHAFSYLRHFGVVENLIFSISCFDHCDVTEREWFLERVLKEQSFTDAPYKIIISTSAPDSFLTKTLPASSVIDLSKCPALREDGKLARDTDMAGLEQSMTSLVEKRPTYRNFKSQIRELMDQCKEAPYLGRAILSWLSSYRPGNPKAGVEAVLRKMAPVTPQNLVNAFLGALAPERQDWARTVYRWVKYAAEPLTLEMLAQALALSLSQDGEVSVADVDRAGLQHDLDQYFGGLIVVDGRDIKFCHDSLYGVANFDLQDSTKDDAGETHKQIAESCLRCLRLREAQDTLAATLSVEQYGGLEAGAMALPRSSLAEYAVRFWAKHYALAGADAPSEQALAFFRDRDAMYTWAEAYYISSNPFTRLQRTYLSPLPYMAMLGLEDLAVYYYMGLDKSKSHYYDKGAQRNQSCWDAIAEAARNGHRSLVLRLLLHVGELDEAGLGNAISAAAAFGKGGALDDLVTKARDLEGFHWPERILDRAAAAGLETLISAVAESSHDLDDEKTMSDRTNALSIAAFWGQKEAIGSLMRCKADPYGKDKDGKMPLELAVLRGDPTILELMLGEQANLDCNEQFKSSAADLAVKCGRPKALEVVIGRGAEFNGNYPANPDDPDDDGGECSSPKIPIVRAAALGYEKCVRILLKNNADPRAGSTRGSALYFAAEGGHVEICRMLLEKGADPNQTFPDQDVLLNRAIATKKKDLVELLVDNPFNNTAKIDVSDPRNTPLVLSIRDSLPDIFQLLLDKGADVNYVGKNSWSPLFAAAYQREPQMVKTLLARGANVHWSNEYGWTPWHAAYDSPETLEEFLKEGVDMDSQSKDGTVLMMAARWGHPQSLRFLLAWTHKPNLEVTLDNTKHFEYTCTALLIACKSFQAECVRILLEAGANLSHRTNEGEYALQSLLWGSDPEREDTLKEVLKFKPALDEADSKGNTVLHDVNPTTPRSIVSLLVESGAPSNGVNNKGYTPLAAAIRCGNMEAARYLFEERRENINVCSPNFGGVVLLAVIQGDIELLKFVIQHQASLDVADNLGRRPIHVATRTSKDHVSELVRAGAELNVRDNYGRSPVHFAAGFGDVDVLDLLMESMPEENFQVGHVDHDGWTPLMWACRLKPLDAQQCHLLLDKLIDKEGKALSVRSNDDKWSPLALATYHRWGDELTARLVPPEQKRKLESNEREEDEDEDESGNDGLPKTRVMLTSYGVSCSSCLQVTFDTHWDCTKCIFRLCPKCFTSRSTVHDEEHHFEEVLPQPDSPSIATAKEGTSEEESEEEQVGSREEEETEEEEEEEDDDEVDNDEKNQGVGVAS
ncbi:ankyrin repeat-containing domain protein [Phialemonium atrogriseum]|uniref:Ankyrin repeat-containing domain protein n=1 Tax=Phialemonium atrogriseum TaxID=1093897 RepID=A0AAJ0BQZ6_9PEZI|nr:ankyrin repeat-containing domain protein [Phialemonium atrogriseum]KAK1762661.1 ankyrin repeat-containing domain protein [Phialemonium atrogriseum]